MGLEVIRVGLCQPAIDPDAGDGEHVTKSFAQAGRALRGLALELRHAAQAP